MLMSVPAKAPERWNAIWTPPAHCTCSRWSPASRTRSGADSKESGLGTTEGVRRTKPPGGGGSGTCVKATSCPASHHDVGEAVVVRSSRNQPRSGAACAAVAELIAAAPSAVSSGSCVDHATSATPPGGILGSTSSPDVSVTPLSATTAQEVVKWSSDAKLSQFRTTTRAAALSHDVRSTRPVMLSSFLAPGVANAWLPRPPSAIAADVSSVASRAPAQPPSPVTLNVTGLIKNLSSSMAG
mmetsp:Transcript_14215/g.34195  ORF Transcript_14215/g.34195 Transcript_14215/m.34195 type:complete len:241 (-) Transcript_14215:2550-3272(-)